MFTAGPSSAPRIFTKLLKPVLSHLRKLGITVSCYLDDCIFLADSAETLRANVTYALRLFDSLGLTVNPNKSVLLPTQEIEFLGVVLNSVDMSATLTSRKKDHIKAQGLLLLNREVSLLELSSFIGMAVAADPAVELAPLRYKYLEIVRNRGLATHHGNYNSPVHLESVVLKLGVITPLGVMKPVLGGNETPLKLIILWSNIQQN